MTIDVGEVCHGAMDREPRPRSSGDAELCSTSGSNVSVPV